MLPKDPIILLSFINTKLRDDYPDLTALCDDFQADKREVEATLAAIDYRYDKVQNQFV